MDLDTALDRSWAAADARRLGIDTIQVVADDGPRAAGAAAPPTSAATIDVQAGVM